MTAKISTDIQQRIAAIIDEQKLVIKERSDVIHASWVATVGNLHVCLLGPGGTGKSLLFRDLVSHIADAKYFETALDETTDPTKVYGAPDIKGMVEEGVTRTITTGMLPEATHAFVDEIFNGNSPVLHSLMPIMNERLFHNNGVPTNVPLRSLYSGTNKILSDADLAAFLDRLHIRFVVDYVQGRNNRAEMVAQAITRMAIAGRGTSTSVAEHPTMVTLAELDIAHKEALALDVDDDVMGSFLDLREELQGNGIVISDRRMVEGMAAVLSNAWVRGHETVQIGDLDILAPMWWTLQEQAPIARSTILALCNPGEKAALDLLDELDKLNKELSDASSLDEDHQKRVAIEVLRNAKKLQADATDHLEKAKAAGADTSRLAEVIGKTDDLTIKVGTDIFNLNPNDLTKSSD